MGSCDINHLKASLESILSVYINLVFTRINLYRLYSYISVHCVYICIIIIIIIINMSWTAIYSSYFKLISAITLGSMWIYFSSLDLHWISPNWTSISTRLGFIFYFIIWHNRVISKMCASRIGTRICPLRVRRFVHWATAARHIDFMLC